jgi:hypothetical protein
MAVQQESGAHAVLIVLFLNNCTALYHIIKDMGVSS